MKKIQILLVLLMVGIPTMEAQNYKMVLKKRVISTLTATNN